VNRALIVWCDGVLLLSKSGLRVPLTPDDVMVPPERAAILKQHQDAGWRVLGLSWQPEIADGVQSEAGAASVFARMNELLGLDIEVAHCPHPAGPPQCWCRKPLPGLAVLLVDRHRLDPRRCIYVGGGPQDPGFARRLGFMYRQAGEFFG
jgi:histidinol phosphatase-like enzyme